MVAVARRDDPLSHGVRRAGAEQRVLAATLPPLARSPPRISHVWPAGIPMKTVNTVCGKSLLRRMGHAGSCEQAVDACAGCRDATRVASDAVPGPVLRILDWL